ncbi:alkaline phosphatase PhoX [Carboxydochorda subterranea]|uniref:Alkaline phosphatase PhoX n=1 Tax=Carboxydichorda subterranea TaxID=3109565 RepID=A0ABZ1BZM1_9FIRM|nr:alkaline phosphatase PhoX [Limnochorda sp. L945t]WRP18048.1 alkaline phosphatase PhoX [Limnochorda sp. L945t]
MRRLWRHVAGAGMAAWMAAAAAPAMALSFTPVQPAVGPQLVLPKGFEYQILISEGEQIRNGKFLRNNDLTVYLPLDGSDLGWLYVNHELRPGGGTRLTVAREGERWKVLEAVGVDFASVGGTWNNCAGSLTPWGTILSAEEYEPRTADEIPAGMVKDVNRYGWVVEVDPVTLRVTKHYAMGRFSHETALVMADRTTVYLTDDYRNGILAKFVADKPGDLSSGTLCVLDAANRRWIEVPKDRAVLNDVRSWALRHGATGFDRPEDIEYNPADGKLYLAITGDDRKPAPDNYGKVVRIDPQTLQMETFIQGGPETGMFNPDNLQLDPQGNLWIFEDKYDDFINARYGNNAVWVASTKDGSLRRFAQLPNGSEGTGPSFTPDGKTLFFSVQHPDPPWKASVVAIRGL